MARLVEKNSVDCSPQVIGHQLEKVLESIVQNSLDLFRTINHNDNSESQDDEEGRIMMSMGTLTMAKP